MRNKKKYVSLFLSILLVANILVPSYIAAGQEVTAENMLFFDDFSGYNQITNALKKAEMIENGWTDELTNNLAGYANGSSYTIPQDASSVFVSVSNLENCELWSDYTVEADICFDDGSATKTETAAIVARATERTKTGYEFRAFVNADGTSGVSLNRRQNADGSIGNKTLKDDTTIEIKRNTTYNLKMTVHGNEIDCYLDNRLVLSGSDANYRTGYIGLRKLGSKSGVAVSFDNLCAYRYSREDLENQEISTFVEDFSQYVGTTAQRVSLFNQNGWVDVSKTEAAYVKEGVYQIPAGSTNISFGLHNYDRAAFWSDYTVEGDVAIGSETVSSTAYLGICGRISNDYSGYEFSIYKTNKGATGVRLYRRGTNDPVLDNKTVTIESGKSYRLKMQFKGNQITCYLGDEQVIQVTDDTYARGSVGIRALVNKTNVSATYDNISVTGVGIALNKHTITATANEGGNITNRGEQSFLQGENAVYTITPSYGYIIHEVKVDGVSVGRVREYEFQNISSNHTIEVQFCMRRGDIDQDKDFDLTDVECLKEVLLGTRTSDFWSDVNASGKTDIVDLIRINKKLTKMSGSVNEQDWTITDTDGYNLAEFTAGCFDTDYQFSAYATYEEDTLGSDSYISLMVDKVDETYYEYRLYNNSLELSAALYQCKDGSESLLAAASYKYIQSFMSSKTCDTQTKMTIVCFDNHIYCFLDDYMIMDYGDGSEQLFHNGTVGYAINSATGSLSNIELTERISKCIMDVEIVGADDNVLNFYEGYDLNSKDYLVRCTDVDGTALFLPMSDADISEFDCEDPGEHSLEVNVADFSGKVTVNVNQRRDYIDYLDNKFVNLKISSFTKDDVEIIDMLLAYYDELSYYEKELLSDKAVTQVLSLREKRNTLCYGESELIYREDFDTELSNLWDGGCERPAGKWEVRNGVYQIQQIPYGLSTYCWRSASAFYGINSSVEADMRLETSQMMAGITFNMTQNGCYYACVSVNNSVPILRLYKKTVSVETLKSVYIKSYGIDLENESVKMRVAYEDSQIQVWLDDMLLLIYDDSNAVEQFDRGYAGVCALSGDASFDNFVIRGTALDKPGEGTVIATTYEDQFDDETAEESPSHWIESNETDDWIVYDSNGNRFYGNKKTDYETSTWLHVFENNPTVSLKMRYLRIADNVDGTFGIYIRQSPDTAYVKVGFDTKQSRWFVTETKGEYDCQVNINVSADTFEFTKNKWYDVKLIAIGDALQLYVNGTLVYSLEHISQTGVGRIGFFAENILLRVDDVSCEFPSGATVQDGVIEYDILPDTYAANLELMSTESGKIIGVGNKLVVLSEDEGRTFKDVTADSVYKGLSGKGAYQSMIRLHDGSYLQVKSADFSVYKSSDGINGWEKIGSVLSGFKDSKNRRIKTFHVNSITECKLENGNYRIFLPVATAVYESESSSAVAGHYTEIYYSDDSGTTWNLSETDTRDILLDYEQNIDTSSWAESKIISCSDGSLRMYYSRNNLGCMQYTVSEDGGLTWSGQYPVPKLQCPKSSFSIAQDEDTGFYYLVWVNDAPYNYGTGFPRTRLSMAISEDGKNWNFVTDVEQVCGDTFSDDVSVLFHLFQIVDPSIEVTDDYVFVTFGLSDRTLEQDNGNHNAQHIRLVRFEKDKLAVQTWDAKTLANLSFTESVSLETLPKQTFSVGDEFGYDGGKILVTALDGTTREVDTARFYVYKMPDMTTAGQKTIVLYDRNGFSVTYTITVN